MTEKYFSAASLHYAAEPTANSNAVSYPGPLEVEWAQGIAPVSHIHRESKKHATKLLFISSPNIDRFKNSFTGVLCGKFAVMQLLNIPPHLYCVATLPCEI